MNESNKFKGLGESIRKTTTEVIDEDKAKFCLSEIIDGIK